jgi:hypothetical protein
MTTTKYKTKYKIKNKTKYRTRPKLKYFKKGGTAFDRGTYGCAFRPPLHCRETSTIKSLSREEKSKYISKFMTKEEADKEIKEMKNIKKILLESPNINNEFINKYYILANEDDVCEIDINNEENIIDLEGAAPDNYLTEITRNTKIDCKDIYTSFKTVKENNHEYRSLKLIDGGTSLDYYLNKPLNENNFNKLNEQLIDLLKNGISTMNKLGIYHCDLKPANMVYKDRIRIIDWGLTAIVDLSNKTNDLNIIKKTLNIKNDMYYGLPFTNILLQKDITKERKELIDNDSATQYLNQIFEGPKPSPYFTLIDYMHKYSKLHSNNKTITDYAIDNLVKVIFSDLTTDTFFYNVFLPNADIFAFIQIYFKMHYALQENSQSVKKIRANISKLLYKYILTSDYATKPYSISEIITDLKNLNEKHIISSAINNITQTTANYKERGEIVDTDIDTRPVILFKLDNGNSKQQYQWVHEEDLHKDIHGYYIEKKIGAKTGKGISQYKHSRHKHSRHKHSRHKHSRQKRSRQKQSKRKQLRHKH